MSNSNELVLDVKDLVVHFETERGVVHAVNGINLELGKKKAIGLVGETGAGKTTTALAILRLIQEETGRVRSGRILIDGKNVMKCTAKELEQMRGKDVAMIFQDPMTALNPVFTVGDQIAETIILHEHCNKEEAYKRALEMLELVRIAPERANDYPHQFSGGMKQRVVIAIALACHPKLLIADEPTTALDVTIQAQVLQIMRELREQYDTSLIMITHNLGIVAEICDEVAVMYAGKIIEKGTLEDVFNDIKHPYTEGLFDSLPDIEDRKVKLKPIKGLMPDPVDLPNGCVFSPRCPYVMDKCRQGQIPEIHFSDTHYASCVAYEDKDFHIQRNL